MQDPQDATKTPPPVDDLSGLQLGRFRVEARIGSGGMGQVYGAQDSVLKRLVAIKRMAPQLNESQVGRERFLKEAQRVSALNHPNIAAIYDVFEENGEVFLVMEFVQGTTIRQYLASHKFTPAEFLSIAIQCSEALAAAHQLQILHGDIKPENIMITPLQRVKILDFGVARRFTTADPAEATQSLATMTGTMSGTPAYMAPEVLEQKPYDGRADLFSLGLVFYEMLGGPQPFQTDSFAGTLGRVLHTQPPPIREFSPNTPKSIAGIVERLLQKDPADRYSNAALLTADLQVAQQGGELRFASSATTKSVDGQKSAARYTAILLGIVVLVGLGFLAWTGYRQKPASSQNSGAVAIPQNRVLAMMPFDAANIDPQLASLGQGVLDSVGSRLSRLNDESGVQVVPARSLKERGITTVVDARKQYGATMGLTVDLKSAGELIKVTYSLIDAQTGKILGGDSLTVPVGDAFAVEDDVIDGAVRALQLKLRPEELAALRVHGTSQPTAYNYYLMARGYLLNFTSIENLDNAITMLREALKVDPNFGMARAAMGEAYWRKYWHTKQANWTKLAKTECDAAVKLGNAGAAGHACLGLVNDGTGQYKDAVVEYQRAVELDPNSEDARIGLALAQEHVGALSKAEETYKSAVELHPQSWIAVNSLGNFYLRQNENAKATEQFKRVTELAPEGYAGYVNLGAALNHQHRYDEAIAALKKSIGLRPTYAAYVNIGTAHFDLHQFKEAAAMDQEALKLTPNQYVTWGNLGEALYYSGAKNESQPAYRKAVELAKEELKVNPKDTDVLGDLANYHSMLGEREASLRYLEQALQYGRNDKQVLAVAAFVNNQLGETGLALEWLNKALQAGYPVETVRTQPGFSNLSANPRFQELVASRSNPTR